MKRTGTWSALALAGALALGACGSDSSDSEVSVVATLSTFTVSAGDTAESQLLAEIYAQSLENAGLRVARKDAIGPREKYYPLLESGDVSLVPELSNSLLGYVRAQSGATDGTEVATTETPTTEAVTSDTTGDTAGDTSVDTTLAPDPAAEAAAADAADALAQSAALATALPTTLTVGTPSSAGDEAVIVCSPAVVERESLATLSDLAKVADSITLGGPADFETGSPVGLVGLQDTYGAKFEAFTSLADGAVADSLGKGDIDCGVLRTTNPVILSEGLIPLTDDLGLIPGDVVVPLMNAAAATPEALDAVNAVSTALTTDVLRALMVKVQVDGESTEVVAKAYLASISSSSGN